jgi:filamentous hemagglutinin family protein
MTRRWPALGLLSGGLLLGALLASSPAQVTTTIRPDGSLGTAVTQTGTVHEITGGTRPGNGPNLFHSFDRFSVGTGDTARFSGPTGIANILSRVTGGVRSDIDGTLQSKIPGANLYLLNPSGVLFGPKAQLDIQGSFHVSTADIVRFADGATFATTLSQPSVLTMAPPAAFGFLGPTPAAITVQGSTLQVPTGHTVSVVGGHLTLDGNRAPLPQDTDMNPTLGAAGGRVQLVSVASPGEIGVSCAELAPDFRLEGVTRLGRIDLVQGALVSVVNREGSPTAGAIEVRGGQLMLTGGSQVDASTRGAGPGGNITVAATEAITLTSGSGLFSNTRSSGNAGRIDVSAPRLDMREGASIGGRARPDTRGNSGDIAVRVETLTLAGGASISNSTAMGQGGSITVVATEAITLTGSRSRLVSETGGSGNAGRIMVSAPRVHLSEQAEIAAGTSGPGNGGAIEIQVGTLTLEGGASILGTTRGGLGGSLTVAATEAIRLAASSLRMQADGSGDAGRIMVSAPRLDMIEMALISGKGNVGQAGNVEVQVGTLTLSGGALITSTTVGAAKAGDIAVRVGTLTLTGGSQISSGTSGAGQAGSVTVTATEAITLSGRGSSLDSSTEGRFGAGDAGQISVSAPRVNLMEEAQIRAQAARAAGKPGDIAVQVGTLTLTGGANISNSNSGPGLGGNVTVTATEAITLAGTTPTGDNITRISSNAHSSGDAGQIVVKAPQVHLMEEAGLRAITDGPEKAGKGGDITVQVGTLTLTGGSQISSSSTRGAGSGGNVAVTATETITIAGQRNNKSSGLFSSTAGPGPGGNLRITAPHIALREGGTIDATSSADGLAGTISIQAGETFHSHQGRVTTQATRADGGDITLQAGSLVQLQDSQITTSVQGGEGRGGNITIDPQSVILERSQIQANAFGGPGGNVRIIAGVFLADPTSSVTASSARNIPGEINIQAAIANLSGLVASLPPDFAPAVALLRNRCAAQRREGAVSTLVERGRDGVPAAPDGLLQGRLYRASPEVPLPAEPGRALHTPPSTWQGVLQWVPTGPRQLRNWPASVRAWRMPERECGTP